MGKGEWGGGGGSGDSGGLVRGADIPLVQFDFSNCRLDGYSGLESCINRSSATLRCGRAVQAYSAVSTPERVDVRGER